MNAFGCILTGSDPKQYGRRGRQWAHVAAWEAVHGPVRRDLVLDHLCCNRACIAIHHLEEVSQSENLFRRRWEHRSRIKTCPNGHDMRVNAVQTPEGGRVCRACNRIAAGRSDDVEE